MSFGNPNWLAGVALLLIFFVGVSTGTTASSAPVSNGSVPEAHHASVRVARFDFDRVRTPFTFGLAILIAGVVKLVFHSWDKLASTAPESCLLITFGLVVGAIVNAISPTFISFTPNLFFLYLLPPIMLEAGYLMKRRAFFDNLGTILLYAVVGTLWNTFAMALGLYILRVINAIRITTAFGFRECILFGAISAAVDPVAVLATFDEVHVNLTLFIMVFGESILNDAVSVVLYQSAEVFVEIPSATATDVILAIVSFFTVSLGGLAIGTTYGLTASFITRFTEKVQILEILTTFSCGYLSFISAEIFHFSGILSAVSCGLIMRHYLHENISMNSQITVKYFMKMLSAASETAIFIFLGIEAVKSRYVWDTGLVLGTIVFAFVFRFMGVFALTYISNRYRAFPISLTDQIIMGYGGLRGAVSFSLVLLLDEAIVPSKHAMFTAAFTLIMFTVFLQGITIKPLVNYLHVAKETDSAPSANVLIHSKAADHILAGIEEIIGQIGDHRFYELVAYYDQLYFTPFFTRNSKEGCENLLSQIERTFYHQAKTAHVRGCLSQPNRSAVELQTPTINETLQSEIMMRDLTTDSYIMPPPSPRRRPSTVSAVPTIQDSKVNSDQLIRQLFIPTMRSAERTGVGNRNHIKDEQQEHRMHMIKWSRAMERALTHAHFSHHNHTRSQGNRSTIRNSRQALQRMRTGDLNDVPSSASSHMTVTPMHRRIVSEGDRDNVDPGETDQLSIATMSDPSIHFDGDAFVERTNVARLTGQSTTSVGTHSV